MTPTRELDALVLEPSSSTLIPSRIAPKRIKPRVKRKQTPVAELYSDWTKEQDRLDIYHQLKKLYTILDIEEKTCDHARQRAMWARRYRNRATQEIKDDLMSDDSERHQRMLNVISLRKATAFGEFKIGERKHLTRKLNRYWKIDDHQAYNRFLRQGRKYPEAIKMAQSDDPEIVKQAAEMLEPRSYRLFDEDEMEEKK